MTISRHLAIAMMYADTTGMSVSEIKLTENFGHFTVTDWNGDSTDVNGVCAITGLWAHCVEIEMEAL